MSVTVRLRAAGGAETTQTLTDPAVAAVAPPQSGALRLPANARLRGANFAFGFYQNIPISGGTMGAEGSNFVNFDWNGWWKPQLDDFVALDGNGLRIWGSPQAIYSSVNIPLATYLARWNQVLDYCASKGIYVYATYGDIGHWAGSNAENVSLATSWTSMLYDHPNVIGVDLSNEAYSKVVGGMWNNATALTLLGQLKDAVNKKGLPAAVSVRGCRKTNGGFTLDEYPPGSGWYQSDYFKLGDFADWHVYDTFTPAQLDAVENATPRWTAALKGKEYIFGECGELPTNNNGIRATLMPALKTLVESNPRNVGLLWWSLWDYSLHQDWQWGFYDINAFPPGATARPLRRDISDKFMLISKTR